MYHTLGGRTTIDTDSLSLVSFRTLRMTKVPISLQVGITGAHVPLQKNYPSKALAHTMRLSRGPINMINVTNIVMEDTSRLVRPQATSVFS